MDALDLFQLQQLVALYGHAADAADPERLRQVFTDDAVIDNRPCGRGLIEGLPAIVAWFGLGKPPHPPSHHSTNVVVYDADGEVRAHSKWLVLNRHDGTGMSGDYHDVFARTQQGWRIRHRIIIPRFPEVIEFGTGFNRT